MSVRILIIDDEPIILRTAELFLTHDTREVITAAGGEEGLEYLTAHADTVDIVLLDLMMPDIYGLDVLKRMKADVLLKNIPVILQTGYADSPDIEEAFTLGVEEVVFKPYKMQEMLSKIEKVLNLSPS